MTDAIEYINADFLVVGSGIAGLYTALKLSKLGKVIILTKEQVEDSNTQFAQGGIAAVIDKGDSWKLHMNDTLKAGVGLCNRKAVEVMVTEGPGRVKELIKMGTSFDHIEGELDLTREGAHSRRRILHARGDATGVEIRESLSRMIKENKNIELRENTFMIDFLISNNLNQDGDENIADNPIKILNKFCDSSIDNLKKTSNIDDSKRISGIWAFSEGKNFIFQSDAVILASGGCGRVYLNTSNPEVTTGDGIAAAYRAGADIMDMEFIQFHPTTFYNPNGSSFLISESVRGEGAVLRNKDGKRFMPEYHHLADLAARDIVARAIVNEAKKDGRAYVWLDLRDLDSKYIEKRFPTIFKTLLKAGTDIRKELIPVVPAAHYSMGGVRTNTYGHTSLPGLYACGEVACTTVHGANRLASNSLLEGLVFGHRIYASIKCQMEEGIFYKQKINIDKSSIKNKISSFQDKNYEPKADKNTEIKDDKIFAVQEGLRKRLRTLMTEKAGIERNLESLRELLEWIKERELLISKCKNLKEVELSNILSNAKLIAQAALLREESRGGHYRNDFPSLKKSWSKKHIVFNNNKQEGKIYELE